MTVQEIMAELESLGSASTKATFLRHGAQEPLFGVKVGDMKTIVKKVKKDNALSLGLYETGNGDAMYLAGLIADEKKIGKDALRRWAELANWQMISEYTVAWIAAESPYGWELALEWIESDRESVASSGWSTLSSWVGIRADQDLDIPALEKLLDRVAGTLRQSPDRVRYTMNGFVIACGSFVAALTDKALEVAAGIDKVHVDMKGTNCKVPPAVPYIQKVKDMGRIGHKKKMARC